MSGLALTAERFAAGDVVLVGDPGDAAMFVATAADTMGPERLGRLQELGRGMVVLALADGIAEQLELPDSSATARRRLDISFSASIDAAAGITGGWSLRDRAWTMRVAADPDTQPNDLTIPGHVHTARIGSGRADAAAAALELARLSERPAAVALCAVIGEQAGAAPLSSGNNRELGRLAVASTVELRSRLISRHVDELAVSCELPTRAGLFRAVGHASDDGGPATVALIHGDPAGRERPLVHAHVACLFGDAFGSLLCGCRAELDAAVAAIVADGAGAIIYTKQDEPARASCGGEGHTDPTVAAGLLHAAGVRSLRLSARSGALADGLRARGMVVHR